MDYIYSNLLLKKTYYSLALTGKKNELSLKNPCFFQRYDRKYSYGQNNW